MARPLSQGCHAAHGGFHHLDAIGGPIDRPEEIARELAAGAERSRRATTRPADYPVAAPGAGEAWATPVAGFIRKHKWGLIGLGLFLLFELVMLTAGGSMGMHF